ncbi:MAG: VRR-NUC domain-containing protein [Xanthomonadales bacterium]|nr:VRR-NUC domain-containing protein [Xanthomonadales bacterium]
MKLDLAAVERMQTRQRTKKRRDDREHEEQAALIRWAEAQKCTTPELGRLVAVPNGGKRHIKVAMALKDEGVKPGYPDILLDVARAGFHGLKIEMKSGDNKTSAKQDEWLEWLASQGYCCYIAYGWIAARRLITEYLAGRPLPGLIHKEAPHAMP